jgi:Flp pilus assembly protein TadD
MAARHLLVSCLTLLLAAPIPAFAQLVDQLQASAMQEDGKVEAHLALAGIYRKSGNAAQAVAVMREAEKRQPANERVLSQLGYALVAGGQYEEAVNVFDRLAAINPANSAAFNGKAVAFDRAGNHAAAQEIYEKALRRAPGSPVVMNNLALSYILADEPDRAIKMLEPLTRLPETPVNAHYNLALAYGIKGEFEKARALNLQRMSPQQADENEKFYLHYTQLMRHQQAQALSSRMQAPGDATVADGDFLSELSPAAGGEPPASAKPAEKGKFWGYESQPSYPGR